MNVLKIFREQTLITVLLSVSLLVIVVGVMFIWNQQKQAEKKHIEQVQLDRINAFAGMVQQELQQTQVDTSAPIQDFKPAESVAKVAELKGAMPDVGTEMWCEWMMVKDGSDWTTDEQVSFAKHCL